MLNSLDIIFFYFSNKAYILWVPKTYVNTDVELNIHNLRSKIVFISTYTSLFDFDIYQDYKFHAHVSGP